MLIELRPRDDGRFDLLQAPGLAEVLGRLADEVRELVLAGDEALRPLFPPAHPDDPERQAAYEQLLGGQLIESRFAAFDTLEEVLRADVVDAAQLDRAMQAVNSVRLVLAERLGLADLAPDLWPGDDWPDDDPRHAHLVLYEVLGQVVGRMVRALSGEAWPEPDPDDGEPDTPQG